MKPTFLGVLVIRPYDVLAGMVIVCLALWCLFHLARDWWRFR